MPSARPGARPRKAAGAVRRAARPGGTRGDSAGAVLTRMGATLLDQLPQALSGDVEAVHQLRVAGRRLRVALGLLTDKPAGHRVRHADRMLRRLIRAAGGARDLDVLLESFRQRLQALPARTAEQRRLWRRLSATRRRGRARARTALIDFGVGRLRKELAQLATGRGPERPVIRDRVEAMADRQGRKLDEGFAALGARLDMPALHGLRRRARRLRYALELFATFFGGGDQAAQAWKTLQDRIGVVHDHALLSAWFERQARHAARSGQTAMAAAAASELVWANATVARLHDELLVADPRALVARGLSALNPIPRGATD